MTAFDMDDQERLSNSNLDSFNLPKLRSFVRNYIDKHQYDSALFWADKVVTLSNSEVQDVYWYAQTLYLTKQYHRASHLIKHHNLHQKHSAARHLLALCHFDCGELAEALDVLSPTTATNDPMSPNLTDDTAIPDKNMKSSLCLLRGRVYEAMDNRGLAADSFREALRLDVFCHEAFDCLVSHHMLTAQEEKELLQSLPLHEQCIESEMQLVYYLYENQLKKYSEPSVPDQCGVLRDSVQSTVCQAERAYYKCGFQESYVISSQLLKRDPYNPQCLPLFVSTLVELNKTDELFYLAHKLVDLYPNKAVSWYSVGCYYFLVGKHDLARRYLSKATSVQGVFGPAWLAFGHSFGEENEHDQAMAAYFTASKIMQGCHLPVLYIGLEYGLTHNAKLAEKFFCEALCIAPDDPFVLHEMGVIAFQNGEYDMAESHMRASLEKVHAISPGDIMAVKWEPLLNNLGHVCRKLKKYEESASFHRQALLLAPHTASTLSALAYVTALMGHPADAVDLFHQALALKRDEPFSTTMLNYCLEQVITDMSPSNSGLDSIPPFSLDCKLPHRGVVDTEDDPTLHPPPPTWPTPAGDSVDEDSIMADCSDMMIETDVDDL